MSQITLTVEQGDTKQSKLLFIREALLIPEKYKNF